MPVRMISVSSGLTKISIRARAKMNTATDTNTEKTATVATALRTPRRIRSFLPAPKFCAMKVEKAFPNSCTGV